MQYVEPLEGRRLFASYAAATVPELITAINAANASAEADTIALAPGATFSLTNYHDTAEARSGLVVPPNSGGLTLLGNGATIERSGANWFRLFHVAAGASLTVRDVTLQGGAAFGLGQDASGLSTSIPARGGAVLNEGTLNLQRVVVQNNAAQGIPGRGAFDQIGPASDGEGGGIYSSGDLTITDSIIRNNTAAAGDGLRAISGLLSKAEAGADGFGGGLFIAGGTVRIERTAITGNVARGGRGGLELNGLETADGGDGLGGGVYAARAKAAVFRETTVTGNQAVGGAALVWNGEASVPGNEGSGIGGGMYIKTRVELDALTAENVTGNTASTSSPNIAGSYRRLR